MANQQIWVHGNSGQLQVVGPNWGEASVFGHGFSLTGRVQDPDNENEPWLHFHIPMPSAAVENSRFVPKLRKVMLVFATDYNSDEDTGYPEETENYYKRYKYVRDFGGAWINQIHLLDGSNLFFFQDTNLRWQSTGLANSIQRTLALPHSFDIHTGLGVSVRVRFKNQMRLQKIEGTFQGRYGPATNEHVVPGFRPEEEPANRSDTKSAIFHAIGCEFIPAAP